MKSVAEWILSRLSYSGQAGSQPGSSVQSPSDALGSLLTYLPELPTLIKGKRVLDFGCGTGKHAVGMATSGAASVTGLDINEKWLEGDRRLALQHHVGRTVEFVSSISNVDLGSYDVVLSLNSMEHFSEPESVLRQMRELLTPQGIAIISFSPPWLSPYGAHMHFFTPVPWVHLIFPEQVVMRVRRQYKADGALRYEDIEGGLNRMTIRRFRDLIREIGFGIERFSLTPVKGLPLVAHIPFVREFLVSRVVAVLPRDAT
jgi:SAM-dependent methyltransferase